MYSFIETIGMIGDKFFRIAGSMFHWVSLGAFLMRIYEYDLNYTY